jgi:ParB-like chromosome segregation protein Spo0J
MSAVEDLSSELVGGGASTSCEEARLSHTEETPQAVSTVETLLEFHPAANLFPFLEGAEFADLVADILEKGQLEPIVLLDRKILDGRNRYRACLEAKVKPRTIELENCEDPLAYVLSRNLQRRHLKESQRAMVGAKLANSDHGGDRRSTDQAANLPLEISQAKAAAMVHVGERLVRSARFVLTKGDAALVRAVEQDKIPVSEAVKAARRLDLEGQQRVAKLAVAGDDKAARDLIREGKRQAQDAKLGGSADNPIPVRR